MKMAATRKALAVLLACALAVPATGASAGPAVPPKGGAGAVGVDSVSWRPRLMRPPLSRPAFVPGEVIVKHKIAAAGAEKARIMGSYGLKVKRHLDQVGAELMEVAGGDVRGAVAALRSSGLVEYAQPNYRYYPLEAAPNDPEAGNQWGLHNTGQNILGANGTPGLDVGAFAAWPYLNNLAPVTVAVTDTGIDVGHPDLAQRLWTNTAEVPGNGVDDDHNSFTDAYGVTYNLVDDVHGWNFYDRGSTLFTPGVDEGHGTHVAGVIAAGIDNGVGVAGVSPNARLMALKFVGANGGSTVDAIAAITYAARMGAKVINASWGGPSDGYDTALNQAIAQADVVFVAAAGNQSQNIDLTPITPAALDAANIISVAAVDNRGRLSSFSNYGATKVDVAAPGENIYSLVPGKQDGPAAVLNDTGVSRALTLGFGLQELPAPMRADLTGRLLREALSLSPGAGTRILLVNDGEVRDRFGLVIPGYQYGDLIEQAIRDAGFDAASGTVLTRVNVTADANGPTAAEMAGYSAVLWFTGDASGSDSVYTLTTGDIANLTQFLADGGKLVLTGRDALYRNEAGSFATQTLGVGAADTAGGGYYHLAGVPGRSLAGAAYTFAASDRLSDVYDDILTPTQPTAVPILNFAAHSGGYGYLSGTSMAAPYVAGIAATVLAQKNLTTAEAIRLIKESGTPLPALAGKTATGKMATLLGPVATRVGAVTAALSTYKPAEASAYTIGLTTGAYGKLVNTAARQDAVTVTFPAGTTLPPAVPAHRVTVNGAPAGSAAESLNVVGQTLTIPVPAQIGHASAVTVAIDAGAGIRNPTAGGDFALEVATTADPVRRASNLYTITPAEIGLSAATYRGVGAENGTLRKAAVTLTAPWQNISPDSADRVTATVTSTADPVGISVTLAETGPDTGRFAGSFGFTPRNSDAAAGLLKVIADSQIQASAEGAFATAVWTGANANRLRVNGTVKLNGYPAADLTVSLRDGLGNVVSATPAVPGGDAAAGIAAGAGPVAADFWVTAAAAGAYTLEARSATGAAVGTSEVPVTLSYLSGYDRIDTVAGAPGQVDEYSLAIPPVTLVPGAPGTDSRPPAVLRTTPAQGAPHVPTATAVRITFDEPVAPAAGGSLAGVTLEKLAGGVWAPVPASAGLTDAAGAPAAAPDSLTLTGFTLEDGTAYRVTVPANTLQDMAAPTPNALGLVTALGFTTLDAGLVTADSWSACGGAVTTACISGFTLGGAAPAHQYKVRVAQAAAGEPLQVQVLNLLNPDAAELAAPGQPAPGQAAIKLLPPAGFTPKAVYGTGLPAGASTWQYDTASGELTVMASPRPVQWNRGTGCGSLTCAAQADTPYNSLLAFAVDAMPGAPAELAGAYALANGQYVGGLGYDAGARAVGLTVAGPHLTTAADPQTGWLEVFLPDSAVTGLWGRDPAGLSTTGVNVSVEGQGAVPSTVTRVTGGVLIRSTAFHYSVAKVSITALQVDVTLDSPIYRGVGAQDVAWDGGTDPVRNKARITVTGGQALGVGGIPPAEINAVVRTRPDVGIGVVLSETAPQSGAYTGSFGFLPGGLWDAANGRIDTDGAGPLTVSVSVQSPAGERTGTAQWLAADESLFRVTGAVTFDPAAVQAGSLKVELYRESDGEWLSQGLSAQGLAGVSPGAAPGAADYFFVLPAPHPGGAFRVVAYTGAHVAVSDPVGLVQGLDGQVETRYANGKYTDLWYAPQPALALAAQTTPPPAPAVSAPAQGATLGAGALTVSAATGRLALVDLNLDGKTFVSRRANGAGQVVFTLPAQADGGHALSLTATDFAGLKSPVTTVSFTVDTIPPARPTVDRPRAGDSQVTGSAEAGSAVTVTRGAAELLGQGTAGPDGRFTVSLSGTLQAHDALAVTAADAAGNLSEPAAVTAVSREARLLALTVSDGRLTPAFGSDVFAYTVDVANATQAVDLTATPLDGAATMQAAGRALAAGALLRRPLDPGPNGVAIDVTAEDGTTRQTYTVTVTRAQPPAGGGGGGSVGGGGGLAATAPPGINPVRAGEKTVTGTAEPGAEVTVSAGSVPLGMNLAGPDGAFTVPIRPQQTGAVLTAVARSAGKLPSTAVTFTVAEAEAPSPGKEPERPAPTTPPAKTEPPKPDPLAPKVEAQSDGTAAISIEVDAAGPDPTGNLVLDLSRPEAQVGSGGSLPVSRRSARVPLAVLERLAGGNHDLVLDAGVATLRIPPAGLISLDPVRQAAAGGAATLRFSVATPDPGAMLQLATDAGYRPAGRVLAFTAEAAGPDGGVRPVRFFGRKVIVTIPFQTGVNPLLVGVYRLDPVGGNWAYRGGRADLLARTVTVELDGFSEYAVLEYRRAFADVPGDHWAHTDIQMMAARHIANGTGPAVFTPGGPVTRAEFAALLVRTLKLPAGAGLQETFTDVGRTRWYFADVETAARVGLIAGSGGAFRPEDRVTRQEMAAMLARALNYRGRTISVSEAELASALARYADLDEIAPWARLAVAQAARLSLMGGRSADHYAPGATASRAEAAVVLRRLLQALGE